jgi:hypothetical protein
VSLPDEGHREGDSDPSVVQALYEAIERGYVEREHAETPMMEDNFRLTHAGIAVAEGKGWDPTETDTVGAVIAWVAGWV